MRSDFVRLALSALIVGLLALAPDAPVQAAPTQKLAGTLELAAGSCDGAGASGSYFRMILPEGSRDGPFVSNGDSTCGDQTHTLLRPGTDGGLVLGAHQPEPSPAFDEQGNSRSTRITQPARFFGVLFSTATNPTDPQTGIDTPPPTLEVDGDTIGGDVRSFGASWNDQEFNQGAPKPDGSTPGLTSGPSGTLDAATGAFRLEWTSEIVGGPFDNFTGLWHLEGTLRTSQAAASGPGAAGDAGTSSEADPGAGTTAAARDSGAASSAGPTTTSAPNTTAGSTATTADGAASDDAEAALAANVSGGREAPAWLVILVAVAGLAALVLYVVVDRAIHRREAAG